MKRFLKTIIDFFLKLFGKKNEDEEQTIVTNESGDTVVVNEKEDVEENVETEEINILTGKEKSMKILIDNGHGYDTAGKRSPYSMYKVEPAVEFYEYKWNREIAKPIVDELVKRGYDAELLVKEDNDVTLSERARRVNEYCKKLGTSNVLLVSVHANAAGNGRSWLNARGWCAFTTKGTTKSDKFAECLYNEAEKNFKGMTIRKDMSDGDRDWEANFTIIYKSLCPAVLTENFFYDNLDDVKYILSEEGRNAVIKTHVDGIINYIKSL